MEAYFIARRKTSIQRADADRVDEYHQAASARPKSILKRFS